MTSVVEVRQFVVQFGAASIELGVCGEEVLVVMDLVEPDRYEPGVVGVECGASRGRT